MKKDIFLNTILADNQIGIFYLGQTGFIIKYKNKYVLIDGYLSDYVDKNCSGPLVKWVRNYPAPIDAKELDFVDYVFCTHSHYDHADPYTLKDIYSVNNKASFFVPTAIKGIIEGYGIDKERITGLECDRSYEIDGDITVMAIPSAHEDFHTDENGDYLEVGYKLKFGDISVFHAGDGCPYTGLEEKIKGSDVLMMPVNGRDYYRTVVCDIIGCFTSREAVLIAKNINADLLIPTHFDLYNVNCINPAEFVDTLKKENCNQKFHIFAPLERYIYQK